MFSFLSLIAVATGILGWYGATEEIFSSTFGLYLSIGSAIAILLFALLGLVIKRKGKTAKLPLFFALPVIAGAAWLGYIGYNNPLSDIVTDPSAPIEFTYPVFRISVPNSESYLDDSYLIDRQYHPEYAEQQKALYPYVMPFKINALPALVYQELDAAISSFEELHLVYKNAEERKFEFVAKTKQYSLTDDFAIQVRDGPESTSFVHIRSRSRVNIKTDFGINAKRVFGVLELIKTKIKSQAEQKSSASETTIDTSPATAGLPETAPKVDTAAPLNQAPTP
ncbi:MAG: DUF1499 domain-containing protein [Oligoflexia bacterium]|nr:DUF1499 domain-containing protein [Oligoflexia bacterium]